MSEQQFFMGVVEDRHDPLKLGRCRIRVVGVHTPEKLELPTEGLPWAIPIQPITSAAMSGIGHAPVGPVEGTWTVVIFTDPESKQQPMFIGTIGGIPVKANMYDEPLVTGSNTQQTSIPPTFLEEVQKNQVPGKQTPPPPPPALGASTTTNASAKFLGQLTEAELAKVIAKLKFRESGSKGYTAVNTLGYVGAWQWGLPMLEDLKYVKKGSLASGAGNKSLANGYRGQSVWAGKNGINSLADFLANGPIQDAAIIDTFKINYKYMSGRAKQASDQTPAAELAGLLCVAHLKGTGEGGVASFLRGDFPPDFYGTSPVEYYNLGYSTISSNDPVIPNSSNVNRGARPKPITPLNEGNNSTVIGANQAPKVAVSPAAEAKGNPDLLGFIDPNLKYPLDTHLNEPDTNRLARHEVLADTIVTTKDGTRERAVGLPNTSVNWSQPPCPYNAQYPFNHVWSSESGHVMEFDDTTGNERIHQYHRAGTFYEIDSSGTQVEKIVGNHIQIIEHDDRIYIKGSGSITIDGDFAVDIRRSMQVEITGDANIKVHENAYLDVTKNIEMTCDNFRLNARNSIDMKAGTGRTVGTDTISKINIENTNGDTNIKTSANTQVLTGADTSIKSGANAYITTGGFQHLNAAGPIAADGSTIDLNSGLSTPGKDALSSTLAKPVQGWNPEIKEYDSTNYTTRENMNSEGTTLETAGSQNEVTEDDHVVGTNGPAAPESETITQTPPMQAPKTGNLGIIELPITKATRLSPNFTLGQLEIDGNRIPEAGQHGLTKLEIVQNLQYLAVMVLEPLLVIYPNFKINSCFRNKKNGSQHEKGEAVDIGFKTFTIPASGKFDAKSNTIFAAAKNLVDNKLIPYDQLLLEYREPGQNWIHISIKRPEKGSPRGDYRTFWNDVTLGGPSGRGKGALIQLQA